MARATAIDGGAVELAALPSLSAIQDRLCLGLLALMTVAAYARVWSFGFLYDDANWLPPIWPGVSWHGLALGPFFLASWLGGGLPWAFHALVLGLHLLNGWLLWLFAKNWLQGPSRLLTVGLFWLHPIQVETVAYLSGGVEALLATYLLCFFLGGLALRRPVRLSTVLIGLLSGLSLVLAVRLKLSAMPLLMIAPIALAMMHKRVNWRVLVGVVALVLLFASSTAWVIGLRAGGMLERLARVNDVALETWRYLALVVWPFGFSIEHSFAHDWAWLAGTEAGLLGVLAWLHRAVWAAPWYAWLWVVSLLLPRGLAMFQGSLLTEHHTYLPFLAIWLLIGSATQGCLSLRHRPACPPTAVCCVDGCCPS